MSDAAISLIGFFAFGGPYAYLMVRMLRELRELENTARRNFPRTVHRPVARPSHQERLPLFG
jgi:2-hydroxychromene-2-carboxylate isomerase